MNKTPYVVALALSKQLKQTVSVGHSGEFMYWIGDECTMIMRVGTSYTPKEMLAKGLTHLYVPAPKQPAKETYAHRR